MEKGATKAGYRFVALTQYADNKGGWAKYDQGGGRNRSRSGFCAYPAEYGKDGVLTYIVDADNVIFAKDTGGKVPDGFPAGWGVGEGWTRWQ